MNQNDNLEMNMDFQNELIQQSKNFIKKNHNHNENSSPVNQFKFTDNLIYMLKNYIVNISNQKEGLQVVNYLLNLIENKSCFQEYMKKFYQTILQYFSEALGFYCVIYALLFFIEQKFNTNIRQMEVYKFVEQEICKHFDIIIFYTEFENFSQNYVEIYLILPTIKKILKKFLNAQLIENFSSLIQRSQFNELKQYLYDLNNVLKGQKYQIYLDQQSSNNNLNKNIWEQINKSLNSLETNRKNKIKKKCVKFQLLNVTTDYDYSCQSPYGQRRKDLFFEKFITKKDSKISNSSNKYNKNPRLEDCFSSKADQRKEQEKNKNNKVYTRVAKNNIIFSDFNSKNKNQD